MIVFFFFQAEDGIRDHAQSRGLGDVYKRQTSSNGCSATTSINISNELVINGDFSAGNTGFTTPPSGANQYVYVADVAGNSELNPEGFYGVGNSGNNYHTNFWGVDHTSGTGKFMIVNGFPGSPQPVV
eukprot:TRINITY_DN16740_c0_g1_i1.p1 TRINITY_DN16740_c0_g1~~TRINITY_DN16740_c0_g1_i1.p1  ORF type:complete len:128 (+),score=16.07 TRINITY_DN16740_c0_g1_i1:61-444(+)